VTAREAAALYTRAGRTPPPEIAAPAVEKVRNTKRKVVNGIEFRSTLEANVYQLLRLWEQAGVIQTLQVQPLFILQPKRRPLIGNAMRAITYTADFSYTRKGRRVVIDAKGYRMEVFRLKAKLFREKYPDVEFQEWDRETFNLMERSGPR
jgi:hypothetical protein